MFTPGRNSEHFHHIRAHVLAQGLRIHEVSKLFGHWNRSDEDSRLEQSDTHQPGIAVTRQQFEDTLKETIHFYGCGVCNSLWLT